MTDHEKRIREALEAHQHMLRCGHSHSYALDMALRYFSMPDDIRALLADLDEARSALTAAKAGGWVAVPVEATPQMVENGTLCVGQTGAITRSIYRAMLAARPLPNPPKEQA